MLQIRRNAVFVFFILVLLNVEIVSSTQLLSQNEMHTNDVTQTISVNRILYVGGSGFGNYSRIQYAIDASNDGDTVFVWDDSSPYFENIIINTKIFLRGENKNSTVIDGRGLDDVIEINDEGVTVSGFTIKNSKKELFNAGIVLFSDKNHVYDNIIVNTINGIYSYDLDNTFIENNLIRNCDNSGISIPFSSNNTIRSNTILQCHNYGIFIYDSVYNIVTGNYINDSGVGIHFWYSFFNTIAENSVMNGTIGLRFCLYSKNNTIQNNIIKDNKERGIELNYSFYNNLNDNVVENSQTGVRLYYSHENVIGQNNIITNCVNGFNVTYSPDNRIIGNTIKDNTIGLKFFSSSYNVIEQNVIAGNVEIGLLFTERNLENTVYYNIFLLNTINAVFVNSVFTHWEQNYWDDWDGKGFYIIDGTMYFGESSFSIPWVNIDFFPRAEPD